MSTTQSIKQEDRVNILIAEANQYLSEGQIDLAIDLYQKALIDKTNNLPLFAYINLSNLYKQKGEFQQAITVLNESKKDFPNSQEIDRLLGSIYSKNNNINAAIDSYFQAIDKNPQQPRWLYLSLVQLLLKKELYNEIIQIHDRQIDVNEASTVLWRSFGIAFAKIGKLNEAIHAYERSIELDRNQPVWIYTSLAKHIIKQHNLFDKSSETDSSEKQVLLQKVLNYFHEALNINQNLSYDDYHQLANCLRSLGREREAASYYVRSIQVNPMGFASYLELDKILNKDGNNRPNNIKENLKSIIFQPRLESQQVKQILDRYVDYGFMGVNGKAVNPFGYYFINQKLKIIYCSIPKNACTLFKNTIVEHSDLYNDYIKSGLNIHEFIGKNKHFFADDLLDNLNSSEYFKFVILRNPFERLVSSYLDKFAKHLNPESFCYEVIEDVHKSLGIAPNIEKSITFSQFVNYIVQTEDSKLNDHWRPQSNFIGSVQFDTIGQFENLGLLIDNLQERFNIKITQQVSSHITIYQDFDKNINFHNLYPQELRKLSGMPKAQQLYTSELLDLVRQRYSQDVELYEKTFNVKLNNYK